MAVEYAAVASLFKTRFGPGVYAHLVGQTPDEAARRAEMLQALRQAVEAALKPAVPGVWVDPTKVAEAQVTSALLAAMENGAAPASTPAPASVPEVERFSPASPALAATGTKPTAKAEGTRFAELNAIFELTGLTVQDVAVYCYLWRRAGKSMVCWPSLDNIAKACRVQKRTVLRSLKR